MTKDKVITTTLNVVKEKKLEKSSIGQIMKEMNISPGSLYYHFSSKNEIYLEIVDYIFEEVRSVLGEVKVTKNNQTYLFNLTTTLVRFLEKREEMLFFLISVGSSSYLDKYTDPKILLRSFRNVLIDDDKDEEDIKKIDLKLELFLGSIYGVLYLNKIMKKRNLSKKEIEEINVIFW